MEDRQRRLELWVYQVLVERRELVRHQQPLVDDRSVRERRHVEAFDLLPHGPALDVLPNDEKRALEVVVSQSRPASDEKLLDARLAARGGVAEDRTIDRHLPPTEDSQPLLLRRALERLAALGSRAVVRQEDHAEAQVLRPF